LTREEEIQHHFVKKKQRERERKRERERERKRERERERDYVEIYNICYFLFDLYFYSLLFNSLF